MKFLIFFLFTLFSFKITAQNYNVKSIWLKDYKLKVPQYVWKDSHRNKVAYLYHFGHHFNSYAVMSGLRCNLCEGTNTFDMLEKSDIFHARFCVGLTWKHPFLKF